MIKNVYSEYTENFFEMRGRKVKKSPYRWKNQWLINFEKPHFDTFYKVFLKINDKKINNSKMEINKYLKFFQFLKYWNVKNLKYKKSKIFGM